MQSDLMDTRCRAPSYSLDLTGSLSYSFCGLNTYFPSWNDDMCLFQTAKKLHCWIFFSLIVAQHPPPIQNILILFNQRLVVLFAILITHLEGLWVLERTPHTCYWSGGLYLESVPSGGFDLLQQEHVLTFQTKKKTVPSYLLISNSFRKLENEW